MIKETKAKTVSGFYTALRGKYLDECDIDSLSTELRGIYEKQKDSKDEKRRATFTDVDTNVETFKDDTVEKEGYEKQSSPKTRVATESATEKAKNESSKPAKKSLSNVKNNEDFAVLVGMIFCGVIFLIIQGWIFIAWCVDGFPAERTIGVFIPTFVVIGLFGVITIVDLCRAIVAKVKTKAKTKTSKGGK